MQSCFTVPANKAASDAVGATSVDLHDGGVAALIAIE
jgi:hypothetical protein